MRPFVRTKRARYVISLLTVVSVLLACGSVWASSEGGHGGEQADSGAKVKDLLLRGMNFAVVAGALFFLLRKPMAKGLQSRRQGIKDQLEDLERQKNEAERQVTATKEKLRRLDQEAQKIVAEYVKQGEAAKAKIFEQAKASAEKLQEQAKKNIEHEFQKAKEQLKAEMAEQAVAMAEVVLKKNVNDDDQKRIIDEYLTKVVVAQ